jgi:hypothetical protein
LFRIQGEDVVAGTRTPEDLDSMKENMPEAYTELVENCNILESHYKDMMVPCYCIFTLKLLHIHLHRHARIISSATTMQGHFNSDVALNVFSTYWSAASLLPTLTLAIFMDDAGH